MAFRKKQGVFISYRHVDSKAQAGRVHDAILYHYGSDADVFRDIDSIDHADNIADEITKSMKQCSAVIVLIGPEWLSIDPTSHEPRIFSANDAVHLEIKAALDEKLDVFPMILDGGNMPKTEDLPIDIAPFADIKAFRVTDENWHSDLTTFLSAFGKSSNLTERQKRKTLSVSLAVLTAFSIFFVPLVHLSSGENITLLDGGAFGYFILLLVFGYLAFSLLEMRIPSRIVTVLAFITSLSVHGWEDQINSQISAQSYADKLALQRAMDNPFTSYINIRPRNYVHAESAGGAIVISVLLFAALVDSLIRRKPKFSKKQ